MYSFMCIIRIQITTLKTDFTQVLVFILKCLRKGFSIRKIIILILTVFIYQTYVLIIFGLNLDIITPLPAYTSY